MILKTLRVNLTPILNEINDTFWLQCAEKGDSPIASTHELLGVLTEEMQEVAEAIRANDCINLREELIDVAVAAIWGIASIDKKM